MGAPSDQRELFDRSGVLPRGLGYRAALLTPADERSLIAHLGARPLQEARYRSFTARRRIASFGAGYDFEGNVLLPAPPPPSFLGPLRDRIAKWTGIPAADFRQCTVAEYRPGTQLGWHRDAPHFGEVAGVSLGSPARMRLRPYPHVKRSGVRALVLVLEPRSAYVLRDEARWRWQHAISPTQGLRYSITFRTMRTASRRPPTPTPPRS
jgi:alkylated DNA repair dioxygenase AlkB